MLRAADGTIQVYGHEKVRAAMKSSGLTHTLIVGPYSVGKRTLLEKLIQENGVTDVVRILNTKNIDMADVRRASTETNGSVRVIMIRMDYLKRTDEERLLKTIEDAPEGVYFLATRTSSIGRNPLYSRFTVHRVDYLSNATVALILSRSGYTSDRAVTLSELALGSIQATINAGKSSQYNSLVVRALKYIEDHDDGGLDTLYLKWEDGHTKLLRIWAQERITGRWRMFQEYDFPELGKGLAMQILTRLDPYERPRYVVRSTLAGIIAEGRR
jgi:hypothetical protein